MQEIHFYSDKVKSTILLITSSVFVYLFISLYEKVTDKNFFIIMISHLGFVLFSFGIIHSVILIFRKKPLLTIDDDEIIIFNPLRKKIFIRFESIESFFITSNSYKGINTSDQINIVMKNGKLIKNNINIINKIFPQFKNVQYAIQVDMLNIRSKELIKILNLRLKRSSDF